VLTTPAIGLSMKRRGCFRSGTSRWLRNPNEFEGLPA
jgi:hypothetical protein